MAGAAAGGGACCGARLDRPSGGGICGAPGSSCCCLRGDAGGLGEFGALLPLPPRALVGLSRGRSSTGSQYVANAPRASSSALSAGMRHVERVAGGASGRATPLTLL